MKLWAYELADCEIYRDLPLELQEAQTALEVALVHAWAEHKDASEALEQVLNDPKLTASLAQKAKAQKAKRVTLIEQKRHQKTADAERVRQEKIQAFEAKRKAEQAALQARQTAVAQNVERMQILSDQATSAQDQVADALKPLGDEQRLRDLEVIARALEPEEPKRTLKTPPETEEVPEAEQPPVPTATPVRWPKVRGFFRSLWRVLNYEIW